MGEPPARDVKHPVPQGMMRGDALVFSACGMLSPHKVQQACQAVAQAEPLTSIAFVSASAMSVSPTPKSLSAYSGNDLWALTLQNLAVSVPAAATAT